MDWIFDNLQILIAAGAGVAYWLNQRNEAKEAEQQNREAEFEADDYDVSEDEARARKIREDIRRKIAERSGGSGPVRLEEPVEAPPPLFERPFQESPPVADPYAHDEWREEPPVVVGPSAAEQAVLERQRVLQERMKELERQRSQTKQLSATVTRKRPARSASKGMRSLRDDLRETGSLRRAIVLREVLGPPVSMR
jgi:hypothetical protein